MVSVVTGWYECSRLSKSIQNHTNYHLYIGGKRSNRFLGVGGGAIRVRGKCGKRLIIEDPLTEIDTKSQVLLLKYRW